MSAAEAARAVFEDSGSELEGFDSQQDGRSSHGTRSDGTRSDGSGDGTCKPKHL